MTPRPVLGAQVRGFSAFVLAPVAEKRVAQIELSGGVDPGALAQLRETARAIRAAADEYAAWRRTSADGSTEEPQTETGARFDEEQMVGTDVAADRLRVTPARVRQLIRGGRLAGRKTGGVWLVDTASLHALDESRRSA